MRLRLLEADEEEDGEIDGEQVMDDEGNISEVCPLMDSQGE